MWIVEEIYGAGRPVHAYELLDDAAALAYLSQLAADRRELPAPTAETDAEAARVLEMAKARGGLCTMAGPHTEWMRAVSPRQ